MAQLVASMSGVVLGGVVEVVGSNLARGKTFSASICSVDSLYPSVYIYCKLIISDIMDWGQHISEISSKATLPEKPPWCSG